ncbi:hypothetical protein GQ53DRAFT_182581 [Thozetella sp. PMI_491]|nr:hypothetical protein GQ53DRAFT_182581 [Thozetella sp. PMI_491]
MEPSPSCSMPILNRGPRWSRNGVGIHLSIRTVGSKSRRVHIRAVVPVCSPGSLPQPPREGMRRGMMDDARRAAASSSYESRVPGGGGGRRITMAYGLTYLPTPARNHSHAFPSPPLERERGVMPITATEGGLKCLENAMSTSGAPPYPSPRSLMMTGRGTGSSLTWATVGFIL